MIVKMQGKFTKEILGKGDHSYFEPLSVTGFVALHGRDAKVKGRTHADGGTPPVQALHCSVQMKWQVVVDLAHPGRAMHDI